MSTKQKILISVVLLTMFNLLLVIVFGEKGLVDVTLLQAELQQIEQQNENLNRENVTLYREIDRLKNDPAFVENIARKELGMVGREEVVFKIKKETPAATQEDGVPVAEEKK